MHIDIPTGLFKGTESSTEESTALQFPEISLSEHVLQDHGCLALSLKAHPISFLREALHKQNILPANTLAPLPDSTPVQASMLWFRHINY